MKKHLLVASLAVVAVGCNQVASVTKKQSDAVVAVVKATCDRYDACGDIGTNKTYSTRTDCEDNATDFWNGQWPVTDCDGKIDGDALTVCTDRIASTDCGNFIDQINTAYNTCSESEVCAG